VAPTVDAAAEPMQRLLGGYEGSSAGGVGSPPGSPGGGDSAANDE
jgi:hypothetical protein